MQLFLFLFFNLLLKIFPAELCWISPIALCDGWCISGYGNLNCFLIFTFFFFSHGHFEMLYPFSFFGLTPPFFLAQHPKPSFGETISFDSERNNMFHTYHTGGSSVYVIFLVWECFTPVSNADWEGTRCPLQKTGEILSCGVATFSALSTPYFKAKPDFKLCLVIVSSDLYLFVLSWY